jgi:hypothetical protein
MQCAALKGPQKVGNNEVAEENAVAEEDAAARCARDL